MKTLIILSHPNITESRINKAWLERLAHASIGVTVHGLYDAYPDGIIDVQAEQELLLAHQSMILQFPFYWFSVPPLLKRWMDDVLVPGFAYGPNAEDRKLTDMPIGIAVSAGIQSEDYHSKGRYRYTIKELLAPVHATASYIGAKALDPFVFYGAEYEPKHADVAASADNYISYLRAVQMDQAQDFS